MMSWCLFVGIGIMTALPSLAEGQARPATSAEWASLRIDGNELTARRTASVVYRSLEALTAALERRLPEPSRAIRLVRASPPQTIDYTLCVTPEGTLVLAQQMFGMDPQTLRPVPVSHGLTRAYPPLEHTGSWMWLVALPVNREVTATLIVRSTTAGWPVRSVTIDLSEDEGR